MIVTILVFVILIFLVLVSILGHVATIARNTKPLTIGDMPISRRKE